MASSTSSSARGLTGDYLLDNIPPQMRWQVVKHLNYPKHIKRGVLKAAIAADRAKEQAGRQEEEEEWGPAWATDEELEQEEQYIKRYEREAEEKRMAKYTKESPSPSLEEKKQNLLARLQCEFQDKPKAKPVSKPRRAKSALLSGAIDGWDISIVHAPGLYDKLFELNGKW